MDKKKGNDVNKIKGETSNFYPKYLDKDGFVINIGDVLFGSDGKAWKISCISYDPHCEYSIIAWDVLDDGSTGTDMKSLKPKWLTRQNPKPNPTQLTRETLNEWIDDIQGVIKELPIGSYPMKTRLYTLMDKMHKVAEREND